MSINFKTLAALCAISLALSGCTKTDDPVNSSDSQSPLLNDSETGVTGELDNSPIYTVKSPDEADCTIEFSSGKVNIDGNGATASETTVTITEEGVYALSGSCDNGKIIVEVDSKAEVMLILNGLELTSADNSVIECTSGDTLILCLTEGTQNTLSDNADYTFPSGDDEPDGAIFSRADLVITGAGALSVKGLYKDGIKCKDGVVIDQGTISITSADDGIVGKDYILIRGGGITIDAGGDGMKSTNDSDADRGYIELSGGNITITAEKDGIQAETDLSISGGSYTVKAGSDTDASSSNSGSPFDFDNSDSDSQKGIKAGGSITISSSDVVIEVNSADDSIHANGDVTISAGNITLSSGDDGIHADESLKISGGTISILKSYEGLEGKNIDISGGEISLKATDDGINAAGGDNGSFFGFNEASDDYYISISGGNITVDASGDGIDSNGTIAQSGGVLTIFGPTSGADGAIDYEKSFAISGGTLIALGSRNMAQAPSVLSQPCLSIYADVSAESEITVKDENGDVIISVTTTKACQSLIFSSEEFKEGESYSIYANNTLLSTVTATDGVSGGGASGEGVMGGGFGGGGFGGIGGNGGGRFDGDIGGDIPDDIGDDITGGFGGDFGGGNGGGFRGGGNGDMLPMR